MFVGVFYGRCLFALVRCFLLYTSCVCRGANFQLLTKKKVFFLISI